MMLLITVILKVQCYIILIPMKYNSELKKHDLYRYYKDHTTNGWIDGKEVRKNNNEDEMIFSKIFSGYIKFLLSKVFEGHDVQLGNRSMLGSISLRGFKKKIKIDENGIPNL